jgi:ketosteroid isomerase-like protein
MNDDDARAFAAAWVDAWNRRDPDAIRAHYATDVVLTSPLAARWYARADGTLRGADELQDFLDVEFHTAPDLHIELHHILIGVDGVTVVYSREDGAVVAEVLNLDEAGRIRRASAYYYGLPLREWPTD